MLMLWIPGGRVGRQLEPPFADHAGELERQVPVVGRVGGGEAGVARRCWAAGTEIPSPPASHPPHAAGRAEGAEALRVKPKGLVNRLILRRESNVPALGAFYPGLW
jgi:hypothetical protein